MVGFKGFNKKYNVFSNEFWKDSSHPPQLENFEANYVTQPNYSSWNGDKFSGGFGITKDYSIVDYWTLRKRSKQLFTENLYARGLIRRLITNEINKGLALEATPDAMILGISDEDADNFAETIERRFSIWAKTQNLCDYKKTMTFGAIQRQARLMAIVSGDVLVILRINQNGTPNIELIDAENVQTPTNKDFLREVKNRGNKIQDGVEISKSGQHIAYFVIDELGKYIRIPVNASKTGRKQAFLYYGTEKMINDVRGQSLLALTIQSFKEVDRYRDAEQRAAVVNAMIATWIEKGENKMSSLPLSSGAVRKDKISADGNTGANRDVQTSSYMPGMVFQELQHGEKVHSYDTKRPNVNFAVFEEAIINAIAWANEIPPEIMTLGFSSNYSASQAAISEFKMYLDKVRDDLGDNLLSQVYQDFFLSEVLNDNIKATGFLEAYRIGKWDIVGGWQLSCWAGAIKPTINMLNTLKAYQGYVGEGWITRDRAARDITGMKFSKVVQQLARENKELVTALQPLIDGGLIKDENPELMNNLMNDVTK
jgi:capsid protein